MVEIAKPTSIRKMGVRGAVVAIPFSAIALLGLRDMVYLSGDGDDLVVSAHERGTAIGSYKMSEANVHIPVGWGSAHGFVPRKRVRKFLDEADGQRILRLRLVE